MFQNIRLRTTLIISYFLIVIIALTVVGALALPLLLRNQNDKDQAALDTSQGNAASALDRVRSQLSRNPNLNLINPFKAYFGTPITTSSTIYNYPPAPDPQFVQSQFDQIAASQNLQLVVLHGNEVWFDTSSDHSLTGFMLNGLYVTTTPTTTPSPEVTARPTYKLNETRKCPASNTQFCLDIKLPVTGANATLVFASSDVNTTLNLYGINPKTGKPYDFMIAAIVSEAPPTPVLGPLVEILAVAGVAALAVATIAGLILARSIARPVVKLTAASAAIARGDYSQTVPVQGGAELMRLSESFNHMAHEVEEYQRMQRELIANVSHELKTPLTAIRGFSQAMTDGALRNIEDFALPAQIINRETERTIRLVNSLLELSKLESGTARFNKEPLELAELLEGTLLSFAPRAGEKEVLLVNQLEPTGEILGDQDKLRQVFNNLIDNALKYTPPNGEVVVSCQQIGNQIVASVTDTGAGIPTADLPRVFERFYQADKSRSKPVDTGAGGLGLGLTICREIVLAHGGKIEVESAPSRGAKFTVTLPVLITVASPVSKTSKSSPPELTRAIASPGLRGN